MTVHSTEQEPNSDSESRTIGDILRTIDNPNNYPNTDRHIDAVCLAKDTIDRMRTIVMLRIKELSGEPLDDMDMTAADDARNHYGDIANEAMKLNIDELFGILDKVIPSDTDDNQPTSTIAALHDLGLFARHLENYSIRLGHTIHEYEKVERERAEKIRAIDETIVTLLALQEMIRRS